MYLVISSCEYQVSLDMIIGIGTRKSDIIELLWNYVRLNSEYYEQTYEENATNNDIKIYKISKKDYDYLEKLYHKYEDIIDKKFSKIKFNPENVMTYFWHMCLENDGDIGDFDHVDTAMIKHIIEKSTEIFDN